MSPTGRALAFTFFVALSAHASGALLSDGYRVQSPCSWSTAAAALTDANAPERDEEGVRWIAVTPGVKPLSTAMFTLPSAPTAVGAPSAVVRLDLNRARLDFLHSTIPKENAEAIEVLGLCLDGALEAWLAHCAQPGEEHRFEALKASSTPQTATVLSSRGFAELDAPDFSALGRNDPISTHVARLPAAIVATERRVQQVCPDVLDQAMAESLLSAMRRQPEPGSDAAAPAASPAGAAPSARDPWANIKGFGF